MNEHKIVLELQKANRKLTAIHRMQEGKLDRIIQLLERIHGPSRFE